MRKHHPSLLALGLLLSAALGACSGNGTPATRGPEDASGSFDAGPDVQPDVQPDVRPDAQPDVRPDARALCECQGEIDNSYWQVECGGLVQYNGVIYGCLDDGASGRHLQQVPQGMVITHPCMVIGRTVVDGVYQQCGGQPCCQPPGGPCMRHDDCCIATPSAGDAPEARPSARCDATTHTCVQGTY